MRDDFIVLVDDSLPATSHEKRLFLLTPYSFMNELGQVLPNTRVP